MHYVHSAHEVLGNIAFVVLLWYNMIIVQTYTATPDLHGSGQRTELPTEPEATVNIYELAQAHDWSADWREPAVLASTETQIDRRQVDVRVALVRHEADRNYRYMLATQVYVPTAQGYYAPVPVSYLHGPSAYIYTNRSRLEVPTERAALKLLGQRALDTARHGGERRAGLFVAGIQGAEDSGNAVYESTAPGLSIAEITNRIAFALEQKWLTGDEAGRMMGMLYAAGLKTLKSFVGEYEMMHMHPHPGNFNFNFRTAQAELYDLTKAADVLAHARGVGHVLQTEVDYYNRKWGYVVESSDTRSWKLPVVPLSGESAEELQAMARHLEEVTVRVALKMAGIKNPTEDDARKIIRLMDEVQAQVPTITYPQSSAS